MDFGLFWTFRPCPGASGPPARDEALDGAAQRGDLADQVRAEERIMDVGHHEERLDVRGQVAVHQGHLELVLEVRNGPQAPDDDAGPLGPGEVDEEAVEGPDLDLFGGAKISWIMFTLSLVVKRVAFLGFFRTATTIRSKTLRPRSMMSTCPLVIGSNDPGYMALGFQHLDSQLVPHPDLLSKYQKKTGLSTKILGEKRVRGGLGKRPGLCHNLEERTGRCGFRRWRGALGRGGKIAGPLTYCHRGG